MQQQGAYEPASLPSGLAGFAFSRSRCIFIGDRSHTHTPRAMTVTSSQFIEPAGDLSVELFPGDDAAALQARVAHFITSAALQIPSTVANTPAYDLAVAAWVYYRAWRQVWTRLSRDPASATVTGEGSTTVTGEQIRAFEKLMNDARATFDSLAETASLIGSDGDEGGTRAVPTAYSF